MNDNRPMTARLSAFVIWALVTLTVAFWGLRLLVRPAAAPLNAIVVGESGGMRGDLSRLFGAEPVAAVAGVPAAPQLSSRFRLVGVMAAKATPEGPTPGVALISIDGKPARAFVAGARVEDQLVLQTVSLRSASIGPAQGGPAFVLEVPLLPPPATGTLAPAPPDGITAAPVAPAAVAPAAPAARMRGNNAR
jgi:general secretion pathway protein C